MAYTDYIQIRKSGKVSRLPMEGFNADVFYKENPDAEIRVQAPDGQFGYIPSKNMSAALKDGFKYGIARTNTPEPKRTYTQSAQDVGSQKWRKNVPESFGKLNIPGQQPITSETVQELENFTRGNSSESSKRRVQAYGQQAMDELEYEKATGKKLRNQAPLSITAPTVARDESGEMILGENGSPLTGLTTDERRVSAHQEMGVSRNAAERLVNTTEDVLDQKAQEWAEIFDRNFLANGDLANALAATSRANKDKGQSDEAKLQAIYDSTKSIFEDETLQKELDNEARSLGLSPDAYRERLAEKLDARAPEILHQIQLNEALPKNAGDYLVRGLTDSVLGGLTKSMTMTNEQRQLLNEADALTEEGAGSYKPGTAAQIGRFGVGLVADALAFEGAGQAAGATIRTMESGYRALRGTQLATRIFGKAAPTATEVVNTFGRTNAGRILNFLAANTDDATRLVKTVIPNTARSALSLGYYENMKYNVSELPMVVEDGISEGKSFTDIADDILSGEASSFLQGAKTGAEFGFANSFLGSLGAKIGVTGREATRAEAFLHGTEKAAWRLGSFAVEAGIFAAPEMYEKWQQGKDVNIVTEMVKGAGMAIMSKINGFVEKGIGRTADKKGNAIGRWLRKNTGAEIDPNDPLTLTLEEREQFSSSVTGRNFYEKLVNLGEIVDFDPKRMQQIREIDDFFADKENNSWELRAKIMAGLGDAIPMDRPRMETATVTKTKDGYVVDERALDNELISRRTFKTEDDAETYISTRKDKQIHNDVRNYYQNTFALDESERKQVVDDFINEITEKSAYTEADVLNMLSDPESRMSELFSTAVRQRMKEKMQQSMKAIYDYENEKDFSIRDLLMKDPIDLTEEERQQLIAARDFLDTLAYKPGKLNIEQSALRGRQAAQEAGMGTDAPNVEMARGEKARYDAALDEFMKLDEGIRQEVQDGMVQGGRPSDILENVVFANEDQRSVVAEYFNSMSRWNDFLQGTMSEIEERVRREVQARTLQGTVNGESITDRMIIVSDGKFDYTLLNGNVRTDDSGRITDAEGGVVIAMDASGEIFPLSIDRLTLRDGMTFEEFANQLREVKQEDATEVIGETEPPKQEERTENTTEGTGGEVKPIEETTNQTEVAKQPDVVSEEPADFDYSKQTDVKSGYDNFLRYNEGDEEMSMELAQSELADAKESLKKIDKEKVPSGVSMQEKKKFISERNRRKQEVQKRVDFWNGIIEENKTRKQELEKANSSETNLNIPTEDNNETGNVVDLQPKVATPSKPKTVDAQKAERIKALKEQYGDLFDDDFSYAQTAMELASFFVGRGRTLNRDDLAKELGYKLGLRSGNEWAETFLAKKGEGKTVNQLAHEAWESAENPLLPDGTRKFDSQEIRDAIIELFNSAGKKSDIVDYALNQREAAAKILFEEQKKQEEDAKILDEKPAELTAEEMERINKELPFEMPTGEDIPDSPITRLMKEVDAIQKEEDTPSITLVDTDRVSKEQWKTLAEGAYDAFLSDEEVENFRKMCLEEAIFYNEETGKITVYSGNLTPEELRRRIDVTKEFIKRLNNGKREETVEIKEDSLLGNGKETPREGREDSENDGERKGSNEPERSEPDEYLKPRNDKEKEIVSDVEKKLADEIKEAEDKVRKTKSVLEKAKVGESDKATDMFSDDKAFKEDGQLFESEDMPTDRTQEGVNKRTSKQQEDLNAAEKELERLQSKAEHDSRVRGALDNERRQTNFDPLETAERIANEERKETDKGLGITRNETPEQQAQSEGETILSDENPLTEEEINNSSLSGPQKTWAKSYLKGKRGELETEAYLEAYEDVRNRRQDNETDRTDADGTQLVGGDDNQEQRPGSAGEQTGELAVGGDVPNENGRQPESGRVPGVEDSTDNVSASVGERSDSSVSGSKPEVDRLPAGGEQPVRGSRTGSDGYNVRSAGADQRGSRVAGQTKQREIKARRDELKSKRDELLAKLKALKNQEKKSGTLQMAVLPPLPSGISSYIPKDKEQRKVFWELATTTAEYGYTYIEEGITKFNDWKNKVFEDFVEPIKDFFGWGQNEVDHYIEQVWNSDYEINGETRTMAEWASLMEPKQLRNIVASDLKSKFEAQKAAESIEVKTGDIDNIRETLPYLLPEQQDDVLKAETQFFDEKHQGREYGNGKGMMFTNGTGTGKTYTGLGIVKRFVKQGKGRVLILTPSQEKVNDWRKDGLNLGLELESLDEDAKNKGVSATKAKGKGVVVTTYANARQNLKMLEDCFDLVVYDESHKIMESKDATGTTMNYFHEMLTNKNVERSVDRQTYYLPEWVEMRNLRKEETDINDQLMVLDRVENPTEEQKELQKRLNARMLEISSRKQELIPIMEEIRKSKVPQAEIDSKRTKTVFLSATPFNVRESLRYAEGYLFSFPEENKNTIGTYNHRSPEDAFFEQMFPAGYRWRYGRLEHHVSNAEALSRQEIDFSDYLQNTLQTMSGRMIASDYDYSRDFPVLTLDNAGRFNQAMSEIYRNKRYNAIADAFRKSFDYNYSTALFEAMKTSLVNDRIKEHLKRGQKVVVFHRRRTSGDLEPPFRRALNYAEMLAAQETDGKRKTEIRNAVKAFEEDFADMLEWEKTIDYTLPREQIEKVFGKDKVAFFSGAENKKTKHQSVEEFMKDNGGKDIIVIQEASGKEGISLHDQTGEHQRVEINLALPQSPIAFIQIEGRIYRIGQKSNAIFEYPLLGLDLETSLFAQRFNSALGTTENLALGSKARNLRKSIATSVLENTGEVDYDRQGLGGKDLDGRVAGGGEKDGFDMAIQDYYGNQKIQRGRDNREGVDYFPTPEPIGYKMVEWAQLTEGETALEPSAGHGAIARYVPEANGMTAIEPSTSLFTKLQMRAGGPGRRFVDTSFEDYPLSNKHDTVVMNPPYGVGGKTAMEHVAKAFRHLNEGGRIVAIIPDGPAMEKRLNGWLNDKELGGSAVLTGEVKLPSVAFGRAGTSVRTRIVVIDKVTREEMRRGMTSMESYDLSSEESIGGLFDRIRNIRMPERTIDTVAINEKKARRTERQLKDNPFTKEFSISGHHLFIESKSRYDMPTIYMDLENPNVDSLLVTYKSLKEKAEHPEKIDYGKWADRSFGRGENKVNGLDAIKDYCEQCIKTLENVTGMTADQMDRTIREREEERKRQEEERHRQIEQARQERAQKRDSAISTMKQEYKGEEGTDYLESLISRAYIGGWSSTDAQELLRRKGIDWETGHMINKNEPVNARTATVVEPQNPVQQESGFEYKLDKNTRTGEDMHLVNMKNRLSDTEYKAVERKAKALGGYYNRFKKAWHFQTEADAKKFVSGVNDNGGVHYMTRNNVESVADRDVQNVIVDSTKEKLPTSKDEALASIPEGGKLCYNQDQDVQVRVGKKSLRHSSLHDKVFVYKTYGKIDEVVRNAIKIGEEVVAEDEINSTKSIGIYYAPVNVDGKQYSARLVIKELMNKGRVLDDLSLYNMSMHKEKTPPTNLNTSEDAGVPNGNVPSGYKVKEIIHNSQENDRKLLGLDTNFTTKYKIGYDEDREVRIDSKERIRKHTTKIANNLGVGKEIKTHESIDDITNPQVRTDIEDGKPVMGWFDEADNSVHLYMPNIKNRYEAEEAIRHEFIGHKGMRAFLGDDNYKTYMRELWMDGTKVFGVEWDDILSKYVRVNLKDHNFNLYDTIDEFLAEEAEEAEGSDRVIDLWFKVRNSLENALSKMGFDEGLSINDVKYMVWLSKNGLRQNDPLSEARRNALLYRLERNAVPMPTYNNGRSYLKEGVHYKQSTPYHPGATPTAVNAADWYHEQLSRRSYVWTEAYVDYALGLKKAMEAIAGTDIMNIKDSENAYLAENHMSSIEQQAEMKFVRERLEPLQEAINKLLPDLSDEPELALQSLERYMQVKHGLERNREFFIRDWIKDEEKTGNPRVDLEQLADDWHNEKDALRADLRNGKIDYRGYLDGLDKFIKMAVDPQFDPDKKDYSGLSASGMKDTDAIDFVLSTESKLGSKVNDFWQRVKDVTNYSLDYDYQCGLISKKNRENVGDMFEYYVPLRGFAEDVAHQVYDYLGIDVKNPISTITLMNAKGRKSLADSPLATMLAMATGSIARGERNRVKQKLLQFVRNHDGQNLITESKVWLENIGTDTAPDWVVKYPDIPENATADEVAQIVKDFNDDMQQKQANGMAVVKRANLNIPYRTFGKEKAQHIIEVSVNGDKHLLIVNGNPRAAQVMNGQMNPSTADGWRWLDKVNRFMSSAFTTWNPTFVASNTIRDAIFSRSNLATKENSRYVAQYMKNYWSTQGEAFWKGTLWKKYREGTLDDSKPLERYFKEFMENGGETGFVALKNVDKWKEIIAKGTDPAKKKNLAEKAFDKVGDAASLGFGLIEDFNERAENLARFNTYLTSRQMGRSILRSIHDAKEVSVNFNRKGAGRMTKGNMKGSALAGLTAEFMRKGYLFFNAGMQSLAQVGRNIKNHPIKFATMQFGIHFAAGMMIPMLNRMLVAALGDDETSENPYANLPEWTRRNNICIFAGGNDFITIPLPIELRAFYGLGDIAAGFVMDKELRSTKSVGEDMMAQLSQILPVDFMGEGGNVAAAFVPDAIKPLAQIARNTDWTGKPIQKENTWNELDPEWTKAYRSTNKVMVSAMKNLSNLTGGDDVRPGLINISPAYSMHLIEGYMGGMGKTVMDAGGFVKNIVTTDWEDFNVRNVPIAKAVYKQSDDRTAYYRTRAKFYKYNDEVKKTEHYMSKYKSDKNNPDNYAKYIQLAEGKEGQKAAIMKEYNKVLKKIRTAEKNATPEARKALEMQEYQIQEQAVKILDNLN